MQATPSKIRSLHQAPRCVRQMAVRQARAPHDQVRLATLRHQAVRDRMAHDSSTTPQVRQGSAVAARDQVALARHSRQPQVRQQLRMRSALARAESRRVAANLRRGGADPLLVLLSDTADRVRVQDRRRRVGSMLRGLRAWSQKPEDRTTNRRKVRRRSRRPPQRGLAASTAVRAPALSLYQSASI